MKNKSQKCGGCLYSPKCFAEKASPRNITINILACRIRNGINANESAKLLLEMIRPKLIDLVSTARSRVGDVYIDMRSLLMDLESRVIECLLSPDGYKIGGPAFLTHYLFGTSPHTGWVKKWILWNFTKDQKFYKRHMLLDIYSDQEKDDTTSYSHHESKLVAAAIADYESSQVDPYDRNNSMSAVREIVEDGVTLNVNEYRVISFCMTYANESNRSRLIDGTHTYLAEIMGVSRPRITRLFFTARTKITNAAQEKGIEL